jgi:hypothetical protein
MTYFAIAANGTLTSLVNVTTLTEFDPSIESEFLTPLTGKVRRKTYSGIMRHDGYIDSVLFFNLMRVSYYRTFMNTVFGGFTTPSKAVALTLFTEDEYYTPFLGRVEKAAFTPVNDVWIRDVRFPLSNLIKQTVTKSSNASLTTSERLVYGNTAGGNVTLTLPAASAIGANTVVSAQKTSASNTLTIQRAGSDTVEGGTSVALTANYGRYDLYSDGVSAWKVV